MTCPCGNGDSLETCCGPYIDGQRLPETAEALMRSRYSAYATGKIDYIFETHDPDRRGDIDRKNTELWSKNATWLGFELLKTERGQPEDIDGVVEFVARYSLQGATIQHRERALFRKHGQRWVFVDGQTINAPPVRNLAPRIGRNDPCPCGSGKKYKRCCATAASA